MFFGLSNNVGNGLANVEEDVLLVKHGLSDAGFMDISEEPEPHGYMTSDMDSAIKGFKRIMICALMESYFPVVRHLRS